MNEERFAVSPVLAARADMILQTYQDDAHRHWITFIPVSKDGRLEANVQPEKSFVATSIDACNTSEYGPSSIFEVELHSQRADQLCNIGPVPASVSDRAHKPVRFTVRGCDADDTATVDGCLPASQAG